MKPDASPRNKVPLCPSAQPDWEGSVAIGVMEGTADEPRMEHFSRALPVNQELLDLANPVTPQRSSVSLHRVPNGAACTSATDVATWLSRL